jgi:hypothetical protein
MAKFSAGLVVSKLAVGHYGNVALIIRSNDNDVTLLEVLSCVNEIHIRSPFAFLHRALAALPAIADRLRGDLRGGAGSMPKGNADFDGRQPI